MPQTEYHNGNDAAKKKIKIVSFRCSLQLWMRVRLAARRLDTTVQALCAQALESYLRAKEQQ